MRVVQRVFREIEHRFKQERRRLAREKVSPFKVETFKRSTRLGAPSIEFSSQDGGILCASDGGDWNVQRKRVSEAVAVEQGEVGSQGGKKESEQ